MKELIYKQRSKNSFGDLILEVWIKSSGKIEKHILEFQEGSWPDEFQEKTEIERLLK